MPRVQVEIVIQATPERVFDFLAEPEHLKEWSPNVVSIRRIGDGPIGVGSTTETVVAALGTQQTLLGRCLVYEPPRRLVVENTMAGGMQVGGVSIGGVEMMSTSDLTPEGTGTRLRATLEYHIKAGLFTAIAEQMAASAMHTDFEQGVRRLKAAVERDTP
ncbi:MAG: SRPBCC family protein [Chloroflexi bacterium]|nr:SRPBCC family protein [Chloroflexota bacterium]